MMYIHCTNCFQVPIDKSPREHSRLEVAFSSDGEIIVRCMRCDLDVTTQKLAVPMEGSCHNDHV